MVKTKHKLLDFSPSYLESVDKIFHIWGWKEFCFPLAVIWIGGSFLLWTFVQTIPLLVSRYFDIEIATTNSITWNWHWVTLGFVIIVVVYYLVLMLLICIQLHKIKDFDDIPFRSAQTLFSWKSSRSFVLAIHQNRPDFNQNKFNDFWSTKKESAIANLIRESYLAAVGQYSDFYFLPEDRFDVITFAGVDTYSGRSEMTEFAILDWLYWLDEKLQVQIFYDTFKRYSETTMIDVVKICSQKTILEYEEIKEIFWNEML